MRTGLAGLLCLYALATIVPARAATLVFDGTSTEGAPVTIRISTDEANLGDGQPPFLSFLDLEVVVGGAVYAVDQQFYRQTSFLLGDRITSGSLDGDTLSFEAAAGGLSFLSRAPGASLLTDVSLTFAEAFAGPLTIDTLFAYLAGTELVAASGGGDGLVFELAPPEVPLPGSAALFATGLGLVAARRRAA